MYILLPKHDVELGRYAGLPFFYLISPVMGGGDWQVAMCNALSEQFGGECVIACPCRWSETHPLAPHFVGDLGQYAHQLEWEQKYIELILVRPTSLLIAWLACESVERPRTDGNPYARDTYGELGYFRGLLESKRNFPLVLGSESGFPGLSDIQCNFDYSYGASFPFYTSMGSVAGAAATRIRSKLLH